MVNEANVQHASRFIFSINVYKYKRRTERHLLSGLLLSSHLNMFRWGRLRAAAVNEQDEGTWKCSSTLFNQVAHQILMQLQKVLSCDRFSAYLTAADLRALLKLSYTHTDAQVFHWCLPEKHSYSKNQTGRFHLKFQQSNFYMELKFQRFPSLDHFTNLVLIHFYF